VCFRRIKIAVVCGLLVGMVAFLSTGCWRKPAPTQKPIRVAFNTWIGYSGFYIAQEKGIFDRLGIKVDAKVIDPLAEKNAALLRGDLDAMGGTIDSTIVTAASGVPGKVVFMFDRSKGTDGILVAGQIKTVQDLAKARIAVEEGFVGHFFLLYYLSKNGLPTEGLNLVPMTTDAAGAAFAAGKVDAAVTWEPYLSTARKRPGARVLVSSAELEPILADTLFVSQGALDQRRDDIAKLVQGIQEADEYWLAHPDEVNQLVARRWNMKPEDVAAIMKTDQLYTSADQFTQFGKKDTDGDLYKYLGKAAELWLTSRVVKQKVDPGQVMDGFAVRTLNGYYSH